MFKKEAEEYANEYGQDAFTQFNMPQWIKPIRMERKLGFQKGAEFGYNKANEWHYVKDGDLPKDKKDMLMSEHLILLTKMKGSDCLSLALGQYNFSTQEFSYQHIVGLTDVIAWKEIVLPELKENE